METVFFTLLALGLIAVGMWLFFGGAKKDEPERQEVTQKDGLSVLPRDQRTRPTIVNDGDALSSMAAFATHHSDSDLSQSRFGFGDKSESNAPKIRPESTSQAGVQSNTYAQTQTQTQSQAQFGTQPHSQFNAQSNMQSNGHSTHTHSSTANAFDAVSVGTTTNTANNVASNVTGNFAHTSVGADGISPNAVQQNAVHQNTVNPTIINQSTINQSADNTTFTQNGVHQTGASEQAQKPQDNAQNHSQANFTQSGQSHFVKENQDNLANKQSADDALPNDDKVAVYDDRLANRVAEDALQQFDGNATVLDEHFHGQEVESRNNQAQATQAISLFIRPKDGLGVSGHTILRLAQDYAMKYGVSNMFHRYEKADGTGVLWFSMLGLTHESIADFDLVALPSQNFNGLVLFLSLPHQQALQGFDSMVAIAKSMADELEASIFDETWEELQSPQLLAMRNLVMG